MRAVAALPVDAFILDLKEVTGPWTLADLVQSGQSSAAGWISMCWWKYPIPPVAAKDLVALRDMGVNGLIVPLETMDAAALAALKADLRAMPRPRPRRRERRAATLGGAAFAPAAPPAREPDPEEGDEDL